MVASVLEMAKVMPAWEGAMSEWFARWPAELSAQKDMAPQMISIAGNRVRTEMKDSMHMPVPKRASEVMRRRTERMVHFRSDMRLSAR